MNFPEHLRFGGVIGAGNRVPRSAATECKGFMVRPSGFEPPTFCSGGKLPLGILLSFRPYSSVQPTLQRLIRRLLWGYLWGYTGGQLYFDGAELCLMVLDGRIKPKRIMSEAQKAVLDKARSLLPSPPQRQRRGVESTGLG